MTYRPRIGWLAPFVGALTGLAGIASFASDIPGSRAAGFVLLGFGLAAFLGLAWEAKRWSIAVEDDDVVAINEHNGQEFAFSKARFIADVPYGYDLLMPDRKRMVQVRLVGHSRKGRDAIRDAVYRLTGGPQQRQGRKDP